MFSLSWKDGLCLFEQLIVFAIVIIAVSEPAYQGSRNFHMLYHVFFTFLYVYYDNNTKSPEPRQACLKVGERRKDLGRAPT